MTKRLGLTDKVWETKSSHMECKGNCGENGGITNRTAEKENRQYYYNRNKEEK